MTETTRPLERRRIGRSDLVVSSVGIGAWAWGAKRVWSYGKDFGRGDIDQVWRTAVERGVNLVDTAPVYGMGASERIIGELLRGTDEEMVVATKYFPLHLLPMSVRGAAKRSLRRLGVKEIDLYQVHWPNPILPLRGTMREMERLVREGKVRYIGVSNFNVRQLEAARSHLSREDVVSNQVHYNLIRRKPIRDGMVEHARREGVAIIAYSPIAQGILSGKYFPGRRPGGLRRLLPRFSRRSLRRVRPLLDVLEEVGRPGCVTPVQTSLAWLLRDPNVVVIPGVKNVSQLDENLGGAACRLDERQLGEIERAYQAHVAGW